MVDKNVDDVATVYDALSPNAVFCWQRVGYSSLANALGYAHGVPLVAKAEAGATVLFVAYQAGTKGLTGIVYQKSQDHAQTWDGEVQISSRQTHASLAAVIHPTLYDIHFVYDVLGEAALGSGLNSYYYRVLAWGVADWAVGAEQTLVAGSTSVGKFNVSLEHRGGYLLSLDHHRGSGDARSLYQVRAVNAWDFAGPASASVAALAAGVEVRPKLVRDDTSGRWVAVVEQGGTWRIYVSTSAAPPGTVTFTAKQAWYEPTTAQFDAAVNPLTGIVGIVQVSAGQLLYRTYDLATDILTDPVVVDDGTGGACHWPAITLDVSRFVVVYARTMAGDQRRLMATWSDNWAAKLDIAQDPGVAGTYGAWGAVHLARGTADAGGVFLAWCDTVAPDADGYRVYAGRLMVRLEKLVSDSLRGVDALRGTRYSDDAVEAEETEVKAAEAKAAAEAADIADAFTAGPKVVEVPRITEATRQAMGLADTFRASEIARPGPRSADTGQATDATLAKEQIVCADLVAGADAIVRIGLLLGDQGELAEAVGGFLLGVADSVQAGDAATITLTISEVGQLAEALGIAQAVADGVAADDVINMVIQVLEEAAASEALGIEVHVAESGQAVDGLRLTVHADDLGRLTDALARVGSQRLTVRLRMHSGKARLKMEGGGGR